MTNKDIKKLLEQEQKNSNQTHLFKLSISAFLIISGVIIATLGFSGTMEIVVQAITIKGKLINASPGILFLILGTIILLKTNNLSIKNIELIKEKNSEVSPSDFSSIKIESRHINGTINKEEPHSDTTKFSSRLDNKFLEEE